jgi:eukaryotic-like serine/threonine-protein kinase
MPMIGKTLAHYEITSQLGKGGMGEVYQAKDRKLGRDVAIKVLPEEFAKDADRVARFQREAKLLASLNHPNIAAIYGLEESGGTNFLVLELVEGETLADQIKRGPIPVEVSLKLALQIAEALEAAHEKGVIHRDLKPANVKVTPDSKVKVLDFGLAKTFAGEQTDLNLSNSPTLSNAATQRGVILGTAAYMSPEQAKGKSVDKRADVWAFGCVMFEMLTGRSVFSADDVSQTLARVLERQPDFSSLPPNLHPKIIEMLERCLEKEAKNRYGSISDARVDIQKVLADSSGVLVQPTTTLEHRSKLRTILPWVAVVLGIFIVGVAVWKLKPPEPKRVMRFTYELPEGQQFKQGPSGEVYLAISPDGSLFVYGTTEGLCLRSVNALNASLIAGTDKSSIEPFFSPDGKWIGYFSVADHKLKKIAISGGAPAVLCETGPMISGASWHSDNAIVYSDILSGIMRISANGGAPESCVKGSFAKMKEGLPVVPQMLPDGKTLLFTNTFDANPANMQIVIQSLKSGERKVLVKGGWGAVYLPTGHLVYYLENNKVVSLFAIPFDLDTLEVTGEPVSMLEGIRRVAASHSGTLVYVSQPAIAAESKGATSSKSTPVWVNKQGGEEPLAVAPGFYINPKISPDGTRVAFTVLGVNQDIWIWDLARETPTRLTFDEGEDSWPLWTPDSQWIVYRSSRNGVNYDINRKAADGSGVVEKIVSWPNNPGPFTWSKDGKTLLSWDLTRSPKQTDISMLSLEGSHARVPLLEGKYNEDHPQISPDGRWLAYASNESGQHEVYVRPYPEVNKGRWQVSTSGGNGPLWSPDGRELFFRNGESVMAVPVENEPVFKSGKPKAIFQGVYISYPVSGAILPEWDISPDGKRFLMIKPPASTGVASAAVGPRKINIVLNWLEELKARAHMK